MSVNEMNFTKNADGSVSVSINDEKLLSSKQNVISGGGGGGIEDLNLHFSSDTPPEDTSKLWVKTDTEPEKILIQYLNTSDTIVSNGTGGQKVLPNANAYMGYGTIDSHCYLFGGISSPTTNYTRDDIYKFDYTTETASTLSIKLPISASYITAVVVGTNIYLFGGFSCSENTEEYLNTILKFDSINETITTLSITLPNNICDMGFGVSGTDIYLFGGRNNNTQFDTILKFDSINETITTLSETLPNNTARYGMACSTIGTKIYLTNGSNDSNGSFTYDTTVIFDTTTEKVIETKKLFTYNRRYARTEVFRNKFYVFGGYTTFGYNTTDIDRYDLEENTLDATTIRLLSAISGFGIGINNNNIYMFGGIIQSTPSSILFTASIEKYTSFAVMVLKNNILIASYNQYNISEIIDNDKINITLPIQDCFIGDSNNQGQQVKVAKYDSTLQTWVEIN